MNNVELKSLLECLADPERLAVFRALVDCGPGGCRQSWLMRTGIAPARVEQALDALVDSGLVRRLELPGEPGFRARRARIQQMAGALDVDVSWHRAARESAPAPLARSH